MKIHQTIIGSVSRLWYFMHRKKEMNALQQAFRNFRVKNPQIVVLSQSKPEEDTEQTYSSRGTGRTRLLREFLVAIAGEVHSEPTNPKKFNKSRKPTGNDNWNLTLSDLTEISKSSNRLEIVAFLDLKHQLLESSTPFHHLFVNKLFDRRHTSISSQDIWLMFRLWVFRILLLFRLSYLLIIGMFTLITLLTGIASNIGIAPTLQIIQAWVSSHVAETLLGFAFLIIITYWGYWRDPGNTIRTEWNSIQSPKELLHQTLVSDNPTNIAKAVNQHLSKSKDYLFVIDDAERLTQSSYDVINAIFDEMVKAQKNVMIIWAYDLNEPRIHKTEDRKFRDISNLKIRNKLIIETRPLSYVEILEIMKGRYGRRSGRPQSFLDSLLDKSWISKIVQDEYKSLSLSGRADLIFGFLEFLEKNNRIRSKEVNFDAFTKTTTWDMDEINFAEQFSLYLAKDQLAVEKILKQIEDLGQIGDDCLEILRCILAFPNAEAKKAHLLAATALEKQVFNTCMSKLVKEIKLLTETDDGYEFSQQDEKLMLWATSWKTWNRDKKYSEKIFNLFLDDDDPLSQSQLANLALYCNPSKETLDVLLKKGKYLANDLGYLDLALDFLAAENGALDQWIFLLESAHTKGESLLKLPEWHYTAITKFDPSEHTKDTKAYYVSALELCKEVGRIYWLLGKMDFAENLITRKWLTIKDLLADLSETSFGARIITLDDEVNFDLAEIHFQLGNWNKTIEICNKVELDSKQRLSYYRDHFARFQALIQLYRLAGMNIEKDIVSTGISPSTEKAKEHRENIKEYREQAIKPIQLNESSKTHVLRLTNRQLLLAMYWSNEQAQNELLKTTAEAIASFTTSGRSLLSDGEILANSAILYYLAFLKVQRIDRVISRLEYVHYDSEFGDPFFYPHRMSRQVDEITGEIIEATEEYKEPSEEEKMSFQFDRAENAISDIRKMGENWSQFLAIIDNHVLSMKTTCDQLCEQANLKIISAKNASLSTRGDKLKFATNELKIKLLSLFDGLQDYLKSHSQKDLNNAFTIFEQLGYAIGLAELYHLSAFLADKESGIRKDKKEKEEKLAEKIENLQKSMASRENLQIRFRCPEGYFDLAKHYEKSGHYPLAGKYYEWSGDYCSTLSFPVLQTATAYNKAGIIYYNTSSMTKHNILSLRVLEKALNIYVYALEDTDYKSVSLNDEILSVKKLIPELHRRLGNIEKATQTCNQLIEECLGSPNSNSNVLVQAYSTMGFICMDQANTQQTTSANQWNKNALDYFEKGYDVSLSQKDIFWKLTLLRLLVSLSIDVDWERLEKYLPILREVYQEAKKSSYMNSMAGGIITLGQVAKFLGDITIKGIIADTTASADSTEKAVEILPATYFDESIDFYIKIGEYYPAIEVAQHLFDQLKLEKYDGKVLAQKLTDLVSILDIDPDNGASMSALDDVYQIFYHLTKNKQVSIQPSEKQECLQKALGFINAKRFKDAIPFLEQGCRICQMEETKVLQSGRPYIPDRNDILIYQRLYDVYQSLNMLKEKQAIVLDFQRIRSLKVSANLLELGEYYEAQNIFPLAIRMYYLAGIQKPDSYFAQHARQHRESLCEKMGPEISPYCKLS